MKPVLLRLLALLLKLPAAGPPAVRVTLSPLTKAAYLAAAKGAMVTKPTLTFPLKKVRGQIVIPTAKGRKTFTDIIIDESAVKRGHGENELTTYTYLGYAVDFKFHLIRVEYYETTQWLLIDAFGKQTAMWGEPVFAPDKKHFVAICAGIEYGGGQPNRIQLL